MQPRPVARAHSAVRVVLAMVDSHLERRHLETIPVTVGGLSAWDKLAGLVQDRGGEFVRSRDFIDDGVEDLVVLWDFGSMTTLPQRFKAAAGDRVIAWSLESPAVAHRAYHRLDRIAADSAQVFAFPGAKRLAPEASRSKFESIYYPQLRRELGAAPAWRDRRFLVMISSNKRVTPGWEAVDLKEPYRSLRILAARVLAMTYRFRRTWAAADLYPARVEAISWFGIRDGFTLYGPNWDRARRGNLGSAIAKSYEGPVPDKNRALQDFRFALAFENTVFPGYITEKLFDCFFAGTIPIYLGAPDVTEFVPAEAVIDKRRFRDPAKLEEFIRSMDERTADVYLQAAADFLRSPSFDRFTDSDFALRFVSAIAEVIDSSSASVELP